MIMFIVACFVHLMQDGIYKTENGNKSGSLQTTPSIHKLAVFTYYNTCNTQCMTPLPLLPSHHFLNIFCHLFVENN